MIIIRIFGGLGNQMFQYAAGRSLADYYRVPFKLDLRWLTRYHTDFQLSRFPIITDQVSLAEKLKYTWFPLQRHPFYYFIKLIRYLNGSIYFEDRFTYNHSFFDLGENKFLFGYFQSEKYFRHIESIIRNEFRYTPDYSIYQPDIIEALSMNNTTAIQFRRGDYVSDKNANRTFGVCPMDYYDRAVEYIETRRKGTQFIVFSDDIDWCKTHVTIDGAVFVERKGGTATDDMSLAAQCKNIIMANSTFSWWSAWLNPNRNKIVVAPARWFQDQNLHEQSSDLIPEGWIRI